MRSSCGYGSRRKSTPFTTLKIAVFAPMPAANVTTTTKVNQGFFVRAAMLARTSLMTVSTLHSGHSKPRIARSNPAGSAFSKSL
jgi:hypothetical protein